MYNLLGTNFFYLDSKIKTFFCSQVKIWFQNRRSKCKKIAKQAQRDNDGQIISPTNSVGGVNAASPPSSTPSPMVQMSQMSSAHVNQYGPVVPGGNGEIPQQQQGQQTSDASSIGSQMNEGVMAMVENGAAQNIHYSAANDPQKAVNTASPSSSKGSHHQMTPSPADRSRIALPALEQQHVNGSLQQQQRALASNSFNCSLPEQQMMHQDAPVAPGNPHEQMQIGGLPIKTEMFQSPMANSGNHYSQVPHVSGDAGMYDMTMTSQQQMYAGHPPPPHLHNPTSCFPSAANQMMHMSSSQQYMNPYMSSMEDGSLPSSAENSYQIPNGPSGGSMAIGACNDLHENGGRYLK